MASGANGEGRKPAKPARRKDAEPGRRTDIRIVDTIARRLRVHCGMTDTKPTEEANRILGQYLAAHGKGRELFPREPGPLLHREDHREDGEEVAA
jgi:hypothetical protein